MSTIQLLSYQANLYSQTDMHSKQTILPRAPTNLRNQQERHSATTDRPRRRQSEEERKGDKGEKKIWREDKRGELNWQQSSMLKSRRPLRESSQPAWASTSKSSSAKQASISLTTNKEKSRKSDKVDQDKCNLLPPLRFSSAPGKSAWRFVLPSPNPPTPANDLPMWYDGKSDDLTVTLGSHRPCSISSSSCPQSDSDSSKEEEESLDSQTTSFDSTFSQSSHSKQTKVQKSDVDGLVHSVLQSLSIYAGPSFSASAPEPCHLPFPSFLTRRWLLLPEILIISSNYHSYSIVLVHCNYIPFIVKEVLIILYLAKRPASYPASPCLVLPL